MATFLDVGLLEFFLPVFTFLLVVALVYAMSSKVFEGVSDRVRWVAAISIGFLVLFSGTSMELINLYTPWFVVMIVFLFLLFALFMFFGTPEIELFSKIGGHTLVLVVALLLLIASMASVLGPVFTPYQTDDEGRTIQSETIRTLFHPRVLGAVFILLIAAFAIQFIPDSASDKK
tara:strand:+ start:2318 stop:2842 length:525 start_codon:yes stop_codon:yes gene_type:complete